MCGLCTLIYHARTRHVGLDHSSPCWLRLSRRRDLAIALGQLGCWRRSRRTIEPSIEWDVGGEADGPIGGHPLDKGVRMRTMVYTKFESLRVDFAP